MVGILAFPRIFFFSFIDDFKVTLQILQQIENLVIRPVHRAKEELRFGHEFDQLSRLGARPRRVVLLRAFHVSRSFRVHGPFRTGPRARTKGYVLPVEERTN